MKAIILKIIGNLKYESTLSGITILAGVVGASLAPELKEAIATATVSAVGVIKILLSDADAAAKDAKK
jgi:hypothetical protein